MESAGKETQTNWTYVVNQLISASHWGIFHPIVQDGRVVDVQPFEKDLLHQRILKARVKLQTYSNRNSASLRPQGIFRKKGPASSEKEARMSGFRRHLG